MLLWLQFIGYSLIFYVGWWLLRRATYRSPLSNIPGPKSDSFIRGNLSRFADRRNQWKYEQELADTYGRVFTINALFNEKLIFTFDPRALHSIFIKDQDVFEESKSLLMLVQFASVSLVIKVLTIWHSQGFYALHWSWFACDDRRTTSPAAKDAEPLIFG
ncbi:hypothetical protein C8Q79DRAFT_1008809 [Trametes meyenii]|nr:hypothetical protein C8Q79DRAFT_1008809 [Trametes meyenii]